MRQKLPWMIACGVLVILLGCSQKSSTSAQTNVSGKESFEKKAVAQDPVFKPFFIYLSKGARENHYVPSGFMGDTQCIKFNDRWQENCHSGRTCIKIVYDIACSKNGQQWAGIYWQNPANNWGGRKGGYDLTGATKLTFWARGETGNERIEEFKVGGLTGDYPDTDTAMVGPVFLTKDWKKYTIDLRGKDLSYIIGGFAWSTNTDVNPESCTFYLDEIKFE